MRVVLADDSILLREGLVRLLAEEGHEVAAAVGDADQLIAVLEQVGERGEKPDAVVVDVRMPPTHTDEGLRAAVQIRERWPDVGVLVLSQYVERRYATELLTDDSEGWDICSRIGCSRWTSSWTRWNGWAQARLPSTPKSYGSY